MTDGTTKLAQVARAKKTCTGCGKTKALSKFEPSIKTGLPVQFCDTCMEARREMGKLKRVQTHARKREQRALQRALQEAEARRQAERDAAFETERAGLADSDQTDTDAPAPPSEDVRMDDTVRTVDAVALGRLIGFAEGLAACTESTTASQLLPKIVASL